MTRLILALPLALAAADAARAGASGPVPGPVAEIVTFRLAPGTTEAAFLYAARAMGPRLAAEPGFLSRRLSAGADGRWTEHVAWASLAQAEAAAARVTADPAVQPFLMAIDPASIDMRHEPILINME